MRSSSCAVASSFSVSSSSRSVAVTASRSTSPSLSDDAGKRPRRSWRRDCALLRRSAKVSQSMGALMTHAGLVGAVRRPLRSGGGGLGQLFHREDHSGDAGLAVAEEPRTRNTYCKRFAAPVQGVDHALLLVGIGEAG